MPEEGEVERLRRSVRELGAALVLFAELDRASVRAARQASRLLAAMEDALRAGDAESRARAMAGAEREGEAYTLACRAVAARRGDAGGLLGRLGF